MREYALMCIKFHEISTQCHTRHIQVFADALRAEEGAIFHESPEAITPAGHGAAAGSSTPTGRRVRKVSALSDFAPVNVRVSRYVLVSS